MAGPRVGGAVVGERGPGEGARVAGLPGHLEDRPRRRARRPRVGNSPSSSGRPSAEGLDGPREGGRAGRGSRTSAPGGWSRSRPSTRDSHRALARPTLSGCVARARKTAAVSAQEGAHLAPRDRAARVERAHAEGGPLRLVHQVPAGDRRARGRSARRSGRTRARGAGPARDGVADVVAPAPEAGAVHRPGRVEPEEVGEHELDAQARLAQGLERRRRRPRSSAVVEPDEPPVAVLAQAGPAVAEQPPAHERGAASGELAEGAAQALAPLGAGEAAPGLPRARAEVLPVVEPGQVRPDDELTHSARGSRRSPRSARRRSAAGSRHAPAPAWPPPP